MSSVPDCITAAGGGNVKFAAAAGVFLKLARRNCLGERQILVGSTMGQKRSLAAAFRLRLALLMVMSSVLASGLPSRIIWSCWTIRPT